jgi:8-oxo-dGTP diphosphatase
MDGVRLAGCVIKDPAGHILLLHRNTRKRNHWEIPGGEIDPDEDPMRAAVREVRQETGMAVEIIRELGTQSFKQDVTKYIYTWYLAEIIDGIPELPPGTHDNWKFFSLAEMGEIRDELSPNVRNFLAELTAGHISI